MFKRRRKGSLIPKYSDKRQRFPTISLINLLNHLGWKKRKAKVIILSEGIWMISELTKKTFSTQSLRDFEYEINAFKVVV